MCLYEQLKKIHLQMETEEFRKHAHQFVDWMADYMDNIEDYPVKSQVQPKEIYNQIDSNIPKRGEDIDSIFDDFRKVIIPGITHWQNPNFLLISKQIIVLHLS